MVALFYAAVDLADDILDGDQPPEVDPGEFTPPVQGAPRKGRAPLHPGAATGDVHRLLLLLGRVATHDEVGGQDTKRKQEVHAELCRGGLAMWEGQETDLRERNLQCQDPWLVIEQKSGSEGEAIMRATARWCDRDPTQAGLFGRHFASAAQLRSDFEDLFSDARDWREARPTLPLHTALEHPVVGDSVRALLAGARKDPSRLPCLRRLLLHADLGTLLDQSESRYIEPAAAIVVANDRDPALLSPLRAMVRETDNWKDRLARKGTLIPDPRPHKRHKECIAAGLSFLQADPTLSGAAEFVRQGFGAPLHAPTFGRLFALSGLEQESTQFEAAKQAAASGDGRFFAGWDLIPPDADTAGQILQHLLTKLAHISQERLLEHIAPDGSVPVWLGPHGPFWRGPCAGTTASAYLGLYHRLGPSDQRLARIKERLMADLAGGAPSPYYTPKVAAGLSLRALVKTTQHHASVFPAELAPVDHMVQQMAGWQSLDGGFGDPFATALLAPTLHKIGRLRSTVAAIQYLVDSSQPDGGWPSVPLWLGLPWNGEPSAFGSRTLTTAWAVGALRQMELGPLWQVVDSPDPAADHTGTW